MERELPKLLGAPCVAFLGLAERYGHVEEQQTRVGSWNILGLKPVIVSFVYPMSLQGHGLCVSFYQATDHEKLTIFLKDQSGKRHGSMDITWQLKHGGETPTRIDQVFRGEQWVAETPWTFMTIPGEKIGLIPQPGIYSVHLTNGIEEALIGQIYFGLAEAPPLTDARIAALKSDPNAIKQVRMQISCTKCGDALRTYSGLERSTASESEQYIWYENLPDRFVCRCGEQNLGLEIIRRNLHGVLGMTGVGKTSQDIIALYEEGALQAVRRNFALLLEQDVPEETIQKFMEENPILLHPFAADEIFFKSPILSLYKTDFTIVNHQKEMILIELERASTRLLKQDGGVSAELQRPFDQVSHWIHTCDEHRAAILDSLKIDKSRIGAVRGVVIAGRDEGYDKDHLRVLKGRDFGRIQLLTYDDVLAAFDALVRNIKSL